MSNDGQSGNAPEALGPRRQAAREHAARSRDFMRRFQTTKDLADLERALQASRSAVELSRGFPEYRGFFAALVNILSIKAQLGNDADSVSEVIALMAEPREQLGDELEASMRLAFATAYELRHRLRGDSADLEAARREFAAALEHAPPGSPLSAHLVEQVRSLESRMAVMREWDEQESHFAAFSEGLGLPRDPQAAYLEGMSVLLRAQVSGSVSDVDRAIELFREALSFDADSRERTECERRLGDAWRLRFSLTGNLSDLEQAIGHYAAAVGSVPDDDADIERYLHGLLNAHFLRLRSSADDRSADETIDLLRSLTDSPAGSDFLVGQAWLNLGLVLHERGRQRGSSADVESAVDAGRRALALLTEPRAVRAKAIAGLSTALRAAAELSGRGVVADSWTSEALDLAELAVVETDPADELWVPRALNAANLAFASAEESASLELYDRALRSASSIVTTAGVSLEQRGHALLLMMIFRLRRHDVSRDVADLDLAVTAGQECLQQQLQHEHRLAALEYLAAAFGSRARVSNSAEDVSSAIRCAEDNLDLMSRADPSRGELRFYMVAAKYRLRYNLVGQIEDLDAAVSAGEEALRELHRASEQRYAIVLEHSGYLWDRSRATDSARDARASVQHCLDLLAEDDVPTSWRLRLLHHVVRVHASLAQGGEAAEDAQQAIRYAREYLDIAEADAPSAGPRADVTILLGQMLIKLGEQSRDIAQLDEAVERLSALQDSVEPEVAMSASFLTAEALWNRHVLRPSDEDLAAAIALARRVADASSPEHARRLRSSLLSRSVASRERRPLRGGAGCRRRLPGVRDGSARSGRS